jgi:hypothetical protein
MLSDSSQIAVVIPVYKTDLSIAERASLRQCLHVLKAYPILLVKPHSLRVDELLEEYPILESLSFADKYFATIEGYNELLASPDFYRQFLAYHYILIYQLDAYVFRDELISWCNKGYDYIGAPGVEPEDFHKLPYEACEAYAATLSQSRLVLNGGLSLRRVAAMIRYLRLYHLFYPTWKGNEDKLFSLDARRLAPLKFFINLPPWPEALAFSFEKSPAASYELNHRQLPFGCHAWERYDPEFWKPFITTQNSISS